MLFIWYICYNKISLKKQISLCAAAPTPPPYGEKLGEDFGNEKTNEKLLFLTGWNMHAWEQSNVLW